MREWGQSIVTSEVFISVGEFFGYSSINAILFGRDFRGQEYTEQEKAVEFCLLCFSAPVKGLKGGIEGVKGQTHHIATDKALKSGWTARLESLFEKGGMTLQDPANKFILEGHIGRHTLTYHGRVYERLKGATEGLTTQQEIRQALQKELNLIKQELINNPNLIKMK